MALSQTITGRDIDEALQGVAEANAPVIITFRKNNAWSSQKGHAVEADGKRVLVVVPASEDLETHLFPGVDVGVSFNLGSRKYIFAAALQKRMNLQDHEGEQVLALMLDRPEQVQRVERRRAVRAGVPAGEIVRASFWPGGVKAKPDKLSPACPTWSGKVLDLSVGGFQLRTHVVATTFFQSRDVVGVCLSFDALAKSVNVDAVVCHSQSEGNGMATIGFEFLELDQSPEGLLALQLIGEKVTEYVDK
ncbi:MAG: PilZ domain-containing protein [Phycisphaerae bacterium]